MRQLSLRPYGRQYNHVVVLYNPIVVAAIRPRVEIKRLILTMESYGLRPYSCIRLHSCIYDHIVVATIVIKSIIHTTRPYGRIYDSIVNVSSNNQLHFEG